MSKYVTIALLSYLAGMKRKEMRKMIGWNRLKRKMTRMIRLA